MTVSQLFECVREGNSKALGDLIAARGDPRAIERSSGYTLLNAAVERGDAEIVAVLLHAGADPLPGVLGNMEEAIRAAHAPIVEELARVGDPNAFQIEGPGGILLTPLMYAARIGSLPIVQLLIRLGSDVNARNRDGNSAAALALLAGHTQTAGFLYNEMSAEERARFDRFRREEDQKQKYTQLVRAIRDGSRNEVVRLIEDGQPLNGLETRSLDCPLSEAVREERWDIVEVLLDRGADVNAISRYSPLTWAAVRGNAAMARRLIGLGADVNSGSPNGKTPLMAAAVSRNTEIVQALLAEGADVNAKGAHGKTAMSEALWEERSRGLNPVVSILRAAGGRE